MTKKQKEEVKLAVLKTLKWSGVKMLFPYRFTGENTKCAYIETKDLLKIIKFKEMGI